jgi:hypothetical protein
MIMSGQGHVKEPRRARRIPGSGDPLVLFIIAEKVVPPFIIPQDIVAKGILGQSEFV